MSLSNFGHAIVRALRLGDQNLTSGDLLRDNLGWLAFRRNR